MLEMVIDDSILQGTVHNPWKLKTSQFFCNQQTQQTCHHALDRRMQQYVPGPANIQEPYSEEEGTSIPQATIINLIDVCLVY